MFPCPKIPSCGYDFNIAYEIGILPAVYLFAIETLIDLEDPQKVYKFNREDLWRNTNLSFEDQKEIEKELEDHFILQLEPTKDEDIILVKNINKNAVWR